MRSCITRLSYSPVNSSIDITPTVLFNSEYVIHSCKEKGECNHMATKTAHSLTTRSGQLATFHAKKAARIKTHKIVKRLQKCALGKEAMLQSELTAARILLDRTMPVLKALEIKTDDSINSLKTITNTQLLDFIEGQSNRLE